MAEESSAPLTARDVVFDVDSKDELDGICLLIIDPQVCQSRIISAASDFNITHLFSCRMTSTEAGH